MNKQKLEVARRAVACDHWRWMEGMRGQDRVGRWFRVTGGPDGSRTFTISYELRLDIQVTRKAPSSMDRCTPDLDDPATLGCLLHLVRESWGDSGAYASPHPHFYDNGELLWRVHAGGKFLPIPSKGSQSEAQALVNALEAAMETEVEQ